MSEPPHDTPEPASLPPAPPPVSNEPLAPEPGPPDAVPDVLEALREQAAPPDPQSPASSDEPNEEEYFWPPPPANDRWKHRRGEPRLFAFLWMVWLIFAGVLSLAPLGPLGLLDSDSTRPACRRLVLFLMAGVAVLWPLVRLSQAMPRRPRRSALQDLIVVLIPAQAIFWPLFLLTLWSWADMLTVSLMMAGWAVLVAGVLTLATRRIARAEQGSRPRHASRAGWSAVFILGALLGPAMGLALGNWAPGESARGWGMTSPLTIAFTSLRERPLAGPRSSLANVRWEAAAAAGAMGLLLLISGDPRGRGARAGPGLH